MGAIQTSSRPDETSRVPFKPSSWRRLKLGAPSLCTTTTNSLLLQPPHSLSLAALNGSIAAVRSESSALSKVQSPSPPVHSPPSNLFNFRRPVCRRPRRTPLGNARVYADKLSWSLALCILVLVASVICIRFKVVRSSPFFISDSLLQSQDRHPSNTSGVGTAPAYEAHSIYSVAGLHL